MKYKSTNKNNKKELKEEIHKKYLSTSKKLKQAVNSSIYHYEKHLVLDARKNPKILYKYINDKQKISKEVNALKDEKGNIITEKKVVVDMLNKQFSSVFNQLEINSAENKYHFNSIRIIE